MKNKPSKNTPHKRNLETMTLLISDSRFQNIILEIRNHLGIPTGGFSKNSKARKWYEKIETESDKTLESRPLIFLEMKTRRNFKQEKISKKMANKQLNLIYEKAPLNYLHNRTLFIIDKFHLPTNFENYIRIYIISGKISAPYSNYSIGPYPPGKSLIEIGHVPIKIYSRLTQKEINELKRLIDGFKEKLPKYKSIKNIDRNLKIEDWYENKERVDEAKRSTYRMSNSEIAKNLLRNSRDGKKIYDIQRDLKKTREERFKFGK